MSTQKKGVKTLLLLGLVLPWVLLQIGTLVLPPFMSSSV